MGETCAAALLRKEMAQTKGMFRRKKKKEFKKRRKKLKEKKKESRRPPARHGLNLGDGPKPKKPNMASRAKEKSPPH